MWFLFISEILCTFAIIEYQPPYFLDIGQFSMYAHTIYDTRERAVPWVISCSHPLCPEFLTVLGWAG